ncbi:MAG: hypothetical protein AB4060_09525 [Crocosphaera sp.]
MSQAGKGFNQPQPSELLPDSKKYFGNITYDPALGCDKFIGSLSISIILSPEVSSFQLGSIEIDIKDLRDRLLQFMLLTNLYFHIQSHSEHSHNLLCQLNINAFKIEVYTNESKLFHVFIDQSNLEEKKRYPLPSDYKRINKMSFVATIKKEQKKYLLYDFQQNEQSSSGSQVSQKTQQVNNKKIEFLHNFLESKGGEERPQFPSATMIFKNAFSEEKWKVFQTWCHMRSRDVKTTEGNTDRIGVNVFVGSHYCNKYQGAIESAINHYAYLKRTQYKENKQYPSSIWVVIEAQLIGAEVAINQDKLKHQYKGQVVLDKIDYKIFLNENHNNMICKFQIPGQLDSFSEIEARCVYAQVYLSLCPKVFLKEVLFEGLFNSFEKLLKDQGQSETGKGGKGKGETGKGETGKGGKGKGGKGKG